jgi:signal transduction histidine kinase|nr:MAG: histidine kinase [Actinomycetota bacterium]
MTGGKPRSILPHLRLDELLAELQVRLEAVLATRDRVHALLEAVVSIGSDLDLETVLRRIVETATTLVDATYGALGVVGEEQTLVQFIPVGLTEEEVARIEHWPHGLGLLGLLIKDPRPLRLNDISKHPDAYGFPPGHPVMKTFLGVPIRVRDEVFGNLYLAEKRGGAEFDEDDEAIVVALATAAGVAIENARLYEETRRRETWLRASSEISTSLLSGTESGEVLTFIGKRAREMVDADVVAILEPDESGEYLDLVNAEGPAADSVEHSRVGVEGSISGAAFTTGEPVGVASLAERSMTLLGSQIGPAAAVPLGAGGSQPRGVLVLGRRAGRLPFSDAELRMLHSFAGQAAIALELAERRKDAERLGLLEDRDRIAKDLHDVVIQRLFAVAMTLMSTVRLVEERPEAVQRLQTAIDELDETIRQIRSTIFALQTPRDLESPSLRSRIVELVEDARSRLGFMPGLKLEGQLDTQVTPNLADQLLAVLREALSNVVRHAKASHVDVTVRAVDGVLTLQVDDNGIGPPPEGGRRSGLRNMQDRAERLGGEFAFGPGRDRGSSLRWSVPLAQEA